MDSQRLQGRIGHFQLFALGFGPIVGSAWVVILGFWLAQAGPGGALLGFVGGTIVMLAIAACYAELTTRTLMTGGEFIFTLHIYGRNIAFLVGWFTMLCWVGISIFEGIALAWFLEMLFPALRQAPLYSVLASPVSLSSLLTGLVGAMMIAAVNYAGVTAIARLQSIFTYGFLAIATPLLLFMLADGSLTNWQPVFPSDGEAVWWRGAAVIFASAAFLFNGFQTVSQMIEERDAHLSLRTIGRIMLGVVLAAGVYYCLVIAAASSVIPWRKLANAELAMVTATEALPGGNILVVLLLISVIASLIKTWNSVFAAAIRTLVALGREGMVPAWLSATDARGTPRHAVLFVAAFNIGGIFLGRGAITPLVDMSAAAMTLCFVLCCLGVVVLRRRHGDDAPYRVPGGYLTITVAVVGALLMMGVALLVPLFGADSLPVLHQLLLGWLALGLVLWMSQRPRQQGT